MGCGTQCAKYTLEIFNILFWLAGAALLGVSIWLLVDENASHFLEIATLGNSYALVKAAAITLCVIGSVVFIVGFLGCFGAMKENVCLLNTYATIVIILLAAQITAGILAVVFKDEILDGLLHAMNTTVVERYDQDGYSTETEAWDFMQQEFKCCGVVNPVTEWAASLWKTDHPAQTVPDTCCVLDDRNSNPPVPVDKTQCNLDAANGVSTGQHYFYQGCYKSMYDWAVDHAAILIGVAFGLAGLQLVVIILACCVSTNVKKNQYQKV